MRLLPAIPISATGLGLLLHLALAAASRADEPPIHDGYAVVRGMTVWIHSWASRGWRRKRGPIENLDLWRSAAAAAATHRIEWRWVRGHADHAKNEYANFLATRAAANGESSDGLVESGFPEWIEEQIDKGRFTDFLDVPPAGPFRPSRPPPAID